jgi:predicted permease
LRRLGFFGEGSVKALNDFVWYLSIPALLFETMATSPLPGGKELFLVLIYYGTAFVVYVVFALLSGTIFGLPREERAMLALSACFANGTMVGVPIIGGAYGDEGLRILFLLIAFHSPFFLTVTTLFVETARSGTGSLGATLLKCARSLTRQTPLISIALGLLYAASGLKLPGIGREVLDLLGSTVAPVGLITVGVSLSGVTLGGHMAQSGLAAFVKLLVLPAAVFLTTHLCGLPPLWIASATLMAAIPTGIVAFNTACAFNIAPRRNATTILFTNIAAIATLVFWLHVLRP